VHTRVRRAIGKGCHNFGTWREMSTRNLMTDKPVIEGTLKKRNANGKGWKERFVVLFPDAVKYYKKKDEKVKSSHGKIPLNENCWVSDIRTKGDKEEHTFVVSDFNDTFYFAAESRELRDFWMHAVARIIRKHQQDVDYYGTNNTGVNRERTESEIERDYEQRLANYKASQGIKDDEELNDKVEDAIVAQMAAAEARKEEDRLRELQKAAMQYKDKQDASRLAELERMRKEAAARVKAAELAEKKALAAAKAAKEAERAEELARQAEAKRKEYEEKERQRKEKQESERKKAEAEAEAEAEREREKEREAQVAEEKLRKERDAAAEAKVAKKKSEESLITKVVKRVSNPRKKESQAPSGSGRPTRKKAGIAARLMQWQQKIDTHQETQESNVFSGAFAGGQKLQKGDEGYGRAQEGTKTDERAKQAQEWVEKEIDRLVKIIKENGNKGDDGRTFITFGILFEIYTDISDSLVGILMRAKRKGTVEYQGDMLFQGMSNKVRITLA